VDRQHDVTTRRRSTIKVEAEAKLPLNWEPVTDSNRWPAVYKKCAHHAPNTIGNFCFEVTLGYRRLERGR